MSDERRPRGTAAGTVAGGAGVLAAAWADRGRAADRRIRSRAVGRQVRPEPGAGGAQSGRPVQDRGRGRRDRGGGGAGVRPAVELVLRLPGGYHRAGGAAAVPLLRPGVPGTVAGHVRTHLVRFEGARRSRRGRRDARRSRGTRGPRAAPAARPVNVISGRAVLIAQAHGHGTPTVLLLRLGHPPPRSWPGSSRRP